MKIKIIAFIVGVTFVACASREICHATEKQDTVRRVVDDTIFPIMEKYMIPGMAVGIAIDGSQYIFNYGVASNDTRVAVSDGTLFELGSITKTFTATLTSWAQLRGRLSLSDKASRYLPALRGTKFGEVGLLNLGTHTPGGLPLQLPSTIKTYYQLITYLKKWQPAYRPGTYRTYANPSIGVLGLIAAKSMHQDFTTVLQRRLFPALGLKNTYIDVPDAKNMDYAQGYTVQNKPVRMTSDILSSEAYGAKSTATDMIRFIEINMGMIESNAQLMHAIMDTHTGYFKIGAMTQDLIWEQYDYPVELNTMLEGSSNRIVFDAVPVIKITPPSEPHEDVIINKTGSTNGFGAYVAFIPKKRMGIVILANKNYPTDERIRIANQIFLRLSSPSAPH